MTTGLEGGEQNLIRSLLAKSERFFTANLPMAHDPGTFWTYNNPAYRLLFPIIEEHPLDGPRRFFRVRAAE